VIGEEGRVSCMPEYEFKQKSDCKSDRKSYRKSDCKSDCKADCKSDCKVSYDLDRVLNRKMDCNSDNKLKFDCRISELIFNRDGLIPAIVQDIYSNDVLMLAYMNEESFTKTLQTGMAHYWSRSRKKLWLKGETSGHYQYVKSINIDCDGDTLLLKVDQKGAACHTGHRSCFFRTIEL